MRMKQQQQVLSSSEGSRVPLHSQFTQSQTLSLSGLLGTFPQHSSSDSEQGRTEPSPVSLQGGERIEELMSLCPCLEGDNFNPIAMDLDTSTDDDEDNKTVQSHHELEAEQGESAYGVTGSTTAQPSLHFPEPGSSPVAETMSAIIQGQA